MRPINRDNKPDPRIPRRSSAIPGGQHQPAIKDGASSQAAAPVHAA